MNKFTDTYNLFVAFKNNLPEVTHFRKSYIDKYHEFVTLLENETGEDLSQFRIAISEIKPIDKSHNYITGKIECSQSVYCERAVFFTKADALELKFKDKEASRQRVKGQITQIKKKENITPINLPQNTRWEDITIKFKNEYDADIITGRTTLHYDYEKMGFADKRVKKKDERVKANDSWKFLKILSTNNGVFPLDKLTGKEKEQRKKQKQSLSKILKELFPTVKDNPFYEYDDIEKNYKIKIKLIPIEDFRGDFRDRNIYDKKSSKFSDLDEFYKGETPSM
jgi:uncharacterized protein YqfB (UPF0267 family)